MTVIERFAGPITEGAQFIKRKKSLLIKHGTHDQKTHGKRSRGLSPEVAQTIQQFTREWNGLSISMVDGSMPTTGFMVSKPPKFGKVVDEADFFDPVKGPKILSEYMREQKVDLATGKNYLGTWLNKGKVFLDVSENIKDVNRATRLGRRRDQIKIWDVVNQVEIDTGGTGGVQTESKYGGTEKPSEYDRRRNRRLRIRDLDKVSRESEQDQIVYLGADSQFISKHAPGKHDQKTHAGGRGGTGSQTFSSLNVFYETLNDLENKPLSDEEMLELSTSQKPEYGQGAVFEYVNNSTGVNNALRDNPESAEQIYGNLISELDETMVRTPNITRSITVYRGVRGGDNEFDDNLPEVFRNIETGDVFSDSAFVSTSLSPTQGLDFAGILNEPDTHGIMLEIKVPRNSEGIFPNSWLGTEDNRFADELEFLLPRNSQFKVLSKEGKVWKLEVTNEQG